MSETQIVWSSEHQTYYINQEGSSCWSPEDPAVVADAIVVDSELPVDWTPQYSWEHNTWYYVHNITGESSWERPQSGDNVQNADLNATADSGLESARAFAANATAALDVAPCWERQWDSVENAWYHYDATSGSSVWCDEPCSHCHPLPSLEAVDQINSHTELRWDATNRAYYYYNVATDSSEWSMGYPPIPLASLLLLSSHLAAVIQQRENIEGHNNYGSCDDIRAEHHIAAVFHADLVRSMRAANSAAPDAVLRRLADAILMEKDTDGDGAISLLDLVTASGHSLDRQDSRVWSTIFKAFSGSASLIKLQLGVDILRSAGLHALCVTHVTQSLVSQNSSAGYGPGADALSEADFVHCALQFVASNM